MRNKRIGIEVKCKICNSKKCKLIYNDVDGYRIDRSFDLYKCLNCNIVFTKLDLSDKEIQQYYDKMEIAFNGAESEKTIKNYVGSKKKFWKLLGYKDRIDEIKKFHPNAKILLDVGCGAGFFLDYAKFRGYEVYGIEISDWGYQAANKKLNIKVFKSDLDEIPKGAIPTPDVITMYDVLEHSLDPKLMLSRSYRLLKKDGILIINLPNISSFVSKINGKYWNKLIPPNHTFHFNKETLFNLVQSSKFKTEMIKTNNGSLVELAAEVVSSMWLIPAKVIPRIGYEYGKREGPAGRNFTRLSIKATRKMFSAFGHFVLPLALVLAWTGNGEGIRMVARK